MLKNPQKELLMGLSFTMSLALGALVAFLWLATNWLATNWLAANTAQAQETTEASTPQGESLTLDSTVRKMLKQNGEFLAEKYTQKAGSYGRISAISELFPSVSIRVNSSLTRSYTRGGTPEIPRIPAVLATVAVPEVPAVGNTPAIPAVAVGDVITPAVPLIREVPAIASNLPDSDINITISQPLYSRRFYRVGERFADYKSGKHRLHSRANDFILETVQAYLEVQTAGEQRQYAEKNLKDIRRLFNRVKARARVDPGQRYLLNRAQTRLSLGEEDLSKVRQLVVARRSKLSRLIGGQEFGELEAVGALEGLPESVEDSLALARSRNPSLLAARSDVKSSISATAGAWGSLIPEISLDLNYRKSLAQSPTATSAGGDIEDFSVGIAGSYTFSSGLTPVFDALAEQQRLRAARFLRKDAERRIEEEINNVWVEVAESRRIHAQAVQFLNATEREKNAYRRQFSAGQRNLLDLLNIQNEFFSAQQRELNARVGKEVARYRILATIGDLVQRFGGI